MRKILAAIKGYVTVGPKFKDDLMKIYSELEKAFALMNSKLNMEKPESMNSELYIEKPESKKNEEGEESTSTSKNTGEKEKKWINDKDSTNIVKNHENVGKHEKWILKKLTNGEDHASNSADRATIIQFKHFDVVPEAADHHYLQSNNCNKAKKQFTNGQSSVYAKIMREWKILEKNLPESIYVQVYETRIDLLRAVIIGPHGTPYHDGLFFFDILLPFDYPKQPPKVYYHSHGYRLNPNLYKSGYVCLSLINTWDGSISEKWTQNSTILQILVSIQGLVLNEKPYFNEPGYRHQINNKSSDWINRSVQYNENAFILSCKTMIHITRKQPERFELFVDQHFRARGPLLLADIKNYQERYIPVGPNFKDDLRKIYSDLEKAFALMNSEPNMEKIENKKKNEEGEASASTKKSRNDKDSSNIYIVKNQENAGKHKKGIWKKLTNSEDHATNSATTIFEFKHFDVVPEASDHYYLQSNKSDKAKKQFNDGQSSVYAKIMREWKILEKTLPESIYVQVYETRIDLLRAVIIGPHGTPYQDGLFFFDDILLPYDYPKQPPKVYYHSHCYRLNPNLYDSGYICLSLINTWRGSKTEKWTQNSTILQILVSIQGLVLNEKPYFNEPGYGHQINNKSWMKYSFEYNETAFILSCKTMLQIMRKRPKGFEVFFHQHFRARGALILAAINDYQKGYVPVSLNFKAILVKIYSDLEKAFRLINRYLNMERMENKKTKKEREGSASTSKSGEIAKKSRNDKDSSDMVKNQENVEDHQSRIFQKIIKWIWE
ncbi:hypothetical protein BUALT_Bualt12G0112000 [Buddleja alternifolia]|uniref:UBC core domain-containing protein n=1 Tax=Buddleja alternifolia TaxID=168488 RepID=A0AAV6WQB0_9LAMI|nr:hypothetical protein BUALT_Bualt12G0112000 [Buddleja alternifolia]